MSIYVAIPSLGDSELIHTVTNLVTLSDNPNDIVIGVACLGPLSEFNELKKTFKGNKNVLIEKFDFFDNVGVGKGRKLAMHAYSGQDYLLQIDSHTLLQKGWDTTLLSLYSEALKETGNKKTILTAYLGRYQHTTANGRTPVDLIPRYPVFVPGYLRQGDYRIPRWRDTPMNEFPEDKKRSEPFLPCTKFNANFSFGNKEFATNTGLFIDSDFFEEEILQTYNLLADGFSLVFPNQPIPLFHLYTDEVVEPPLGKRNNAGDLAKPTNVDYERLMRENYANYINDPKNQPQLQKFHKYSRVHPKYGSPQTWYIPGSYTR